MMEGQSAIVTGSTSGIGLGVAEALTRTGANVVLNGFGEASEVEQLRAKRDRAPCTYLSVDFRIAARRERLLMADGGYRVDRSHRRT